MRLQNHIAYRFLTDASFLMETIEQVHPAAYKHLSDGGSPSEEILSLYKLLDYEDQKTYMVTETVLDKLDLLHVKKHFIEGIGEHYDWTVFSAIKECKKTFILPDWDKTQQVLRMWVTHDTISFCHLAFKFDEGSKIYGESNHCLFYVNRKTGAQCDHFNHIDVKKVEEFIYKLLCFIYLADNEEIIVAPNAKHGTKATGRFINELKIPITVINSKWNITSVRSEKFAVRGHFAIRWSGEGRSIAKLVFIEPFEKNGYVRKAQKLQES